MEKKISFAMYKPREGKASELKDILKEHVPTLREFGLITDMEALTLQSEDGTIVEIFEWTSDEAKEQAHQHPAIMKLWGKMGPICDFPKMKDLPEADKSFPNFAVAE